MVDQIVTKSSVVCKKETLLSISGEAMTGFHP